MTCFREVTLQRLVVKVEQIEGETLSLTAEQHHYLRRVLRLQVGDRFVAFAGDGQRWLATVTSRPRQALLSSLGTSPSAGASSCSPSPQITLAACLPKQGFDDVVRQATELGVDHIVPVISDRTLLRPSPNKVERWRRIAAEAAEQSERFTVPELSDPIPWPAWLQADGNHHRCLCVARHSAPPLLTWCLSTPMDTIVVAIGPEGGWTATEIDQAIAADYQLVTLGRAILRAVTASIVALSILHVGLDFASMEPYQFAQP